LEKDIIFFHKDISKKREKVIYGYG
jgi:hypothetical protein